MKKRSLLRKKKEKKKNNEVFLAKRKNPKPEVNNLSLFFSNIVDGLFSVYIFIVKIVLNSIR